ncbi:uncharacterized protein G2W53_004071 [Senna tora]|uniref:Uncharacterized protein n=1 Tax=Senna tora TaxID=362788 RepID=A0A834XCB3_9FABA|nr:uncharacterized protein G2W53_004071 [Senna tora]
MEEWGVWWWGKAHGCGDLKEEGENGSEEGERMVVTVWGV